jgi:hypothetical protein
VTGGDTPEGEERERAVLVGLPSGLGHRAAIEAAAELARLFGLPLSGLYVEETHLLELWDTAEGRGAAHVRTRYMRAALARHGQRARSELEGVATRARIAVSFASRQGALTEAVAEATGPGDIVVVPLDLSERRLAPLVARAAALAERSAGVLMVPEARPARTGAVAALAGEGARTVPLAGEIALGLRVPLTVLVPGGRPERLAAARAEVPEEAAARLPVELCAVPADRPLAAEECGRRTVRLLVADAAEADRIAVDAAEGPVRRDRAALLLVHRAPEGTDGAPG